MRRRTIVAIALVVSVVSAGVILGQRIGPFSQASRKKAAPQLDAGITPASFDPASPSKEYIYAGSALIATEEPAGSVCTPSISPPSNSHPSTGGGGSVTVTVAGGCPWTAVSNAVWITITSGSTGSGNGTVNYSVAPSSGAPRSGTLTVANQTFMVNQEAIGCGSFGISPTNQSFNSSGGTDSVTVTAVAACAWTATSNASWITITSGATGSGNGSVGYSIAANASSSQRTGTMTVATQIFTVTQTGSVCSFSISPTGQSFASTGGTGSVTVTGAVGCSWTAGSNPAWITITSGTSGSGNGTVNYSVASNGGGPRNGTITIATQAFTVSQSAANCTYSISPPSQSFASGGGPGTVTVTAGAGCTWSVVSSPSWIAFNSGSSGTGNGTLNYSVGINTGVVRSGTINISGQLLAVSQAAGVTGGCNTLSMSPPTQSVLKAGGAFSVSVINLVPAGCSWTATSSVTWITITSGGSGAGTGTITYTVAAYIGGTVTRQGLITIGTVGGPATLSVKQSP
jgi:hypothetical protein